jgi:ubiquinol-cytochrome c reductase cytochrome c1 subunit
MKKILLALLVSFGCVTAVSANEGGYPWDKFPVEKMNDMAALQNGAKVFVNYCLNCHSAAYMRYNRMQDIGLTEAQIKSLRPRRSATR